jgi:hypothetical protein
MSKSKFREELEHVRSLIGILKTTTPKGLQPGAYDTISDLADKWLTELDKNQLAIEGVGTFTKEQLHKYIDRTIFDLKMLRDLSRLDKTSLIWRLEGWKEMLNNLVETPPQFDKPIIDSHLEHLDGWYILNVTYPLSDSGNEQGYRDVLRRKDGDRVFNREGNFCDFWHNYEVLIYLGTKFEDIGKRE